MKIALVTCQRPYHAQGSGEVVRLMGRGWGCRCRAGAAVAPVNVQGVGVEQAGIGKLGGDHRDGDTLGIDFEC